jgi:hypothetical protein
MPVRCFGTVLRLALSLIDIDTEIKQELAAHLAIRRRPAGRTRSNAKKRCHAPIVLKLLVFLAPRQSPGLHKVGECMPTHTRRLLVSCVTTASWRLLSPPELPSALV